MNLETQQGPAPSVLNSEGVADSQIHQGPAPSVRNSEAVADTQIVDQENIHSGNGNADATTPQVMPVHAEVVEEEYMKRTTGQVVLLLSFLFSVVFWIITLVSQAITASKTGSVDRTLWFGIVIQALLTFIVFKVVSPSFENAASAYGVQISIFSALATVFAVTGVDQNIHSGRPALKATGAGWLLIILVDLFWIILFTSPQSPIFQPDFSFTLPRRSLWRGGEDKLNKVEKIGRSTEAFPMSPANRRSSVPTTGDQRSSRGSRLSKRRINLNLQRKTQSDFSSKKSEEMNRRSSGALPSEGELEYVDEKPRDGDDVNQQPDTAPLKEEGVVQAEAMFSYTGSPEDRKELTFKKGDILTILEKSGKWWEARTKDGKEGIVPSNYLRILPESG